MNENQIYSKVFAWFFAGLMITFISGYCLSLNDTLLYQVVSVGMAPIVLIELIIAIVMGVRIQKMKPITAKICYLIYSITTGVTFGTIFYVYELSSILSTFLITAILFGILAAFGYFTKKDVTKLSTLLFVTLLAALLVSVFNIFIQSSQLELLLSIVFIVVFMGYIVYDMKNIKPLVLYMDEDNAAIYGAFQLYLDFINLFIRLLRFLGKSKD